MDKDESQVEQSGCGCDSSSGDDVCCTPGSGKSNWRTALFIVAVVLAGGVAAHSVLTNGGSATPCGGAGAICAIEGNGNGGGQACAMTAACALEQSNGNGGEACSKIAACTLEQSNGNGGGQACSIDCPSEKGCCQDAPGKAAGCCPAAAPADPAPQPAPTGCCPAAAPPAPTPQAPASGCCPGH